MNSFHQVPALCQALGRRRGDSEMGVVPVLAEGFLILVSSGFCATRFTADWGTPECGPECEEGGLGTDSHLVSGDSPACGPSGSLGAVMLEQGAPLCSGSLWADPRDASCACTWQSVLSMAHH